MSVGGEAGSGVEAAMWELRSSKASGGAELGAVILMEFWVGFHRFKVKFIEGLYIVESFLSEGKPETIGEVHNGGVGGRW